MSFESYRKKIEDPKSPEHKKLLKKCKSLIDLSRSDMAKNYSTWDDNDLVFRGLRVKDKEDINSDAKGQPTKMAIQLAYSQVLTFISFCIMMLTQNKRFYELEPTGSEDTDISEECELVLERDCKKNAWILFLFQYLLDLSKFSLGAAEACYKEDYKFMRVPKDVTVQGAFGSQTEETVNSFEKIPVFVGNKVYNVSPYRFFPDTRLPLTRFQEGEFCGSEDMFSISALKADISLFNLDKIPKFDEKQYQERVKISRIDGGLSTRASMDNGQLGAHESLAGDTDGKGFVAEGSVVVTKIVVDLVPTHFDKELGSEKHPIRYIVWYANDETIIRFEEAYYLHCQFPYICSQFLPDQHKKVNESLSDLCAQTSGLITWLINAHTTAQKSSLDGKFAVDPSGVDMKSLQSRSPYIFLKKSASNLGIDRYIKQFTTSDTTAGYMGDAAQIKDLQESITGFASFMQGQSSQGRRSATQDAVVARGGSARGKVHLSCIWEAFAALGKQFLANNRQEMDEETYKRIIGEENFNPDKFARFKADPVSIATSEDFFIFDGTLPSEKSFLAQSLQEILVTLMSNPQVAMILGYDGEAVQELFKQVYILRGVTPARLPTPKPMAMQPPGVPPVASPQPPVVSNG